MRFFDLRLGPLKGLCHSNMTMTYTIRRTILKILLFPSILAVLGMIASWISWFAGLYGLENPSNVILWWGVIRISHSSAFIWSLIAISIFVCIGFFGELLLRRSFSRSPSPEMFFLRIFLLSLPLQCVRLILPLVFDGTLSVSYGLTATRVAWFGRFAGIIALLNISLNSSDTPFWRSGSIMSMGVLASLVFAVMVPLDVTQPMINLLYRTVTGSAIAFSCIALELLAVISLLGVAVDRINNRYYILALSLLTLVAGYELLFFGYRIFIIPGTVLIIGAITLFTYQTRKIYQWL